MPAIRNKAIITATIFIAFFFMHSGHIMAQKKEFKTYKNNLTINLTRFILNEARFGYERSFSERHIGRIVLGFQYPTSSESFNSGTLALGYSPNYYKVSKGIYTALGYNYILGKHSRIYVSGEVYFSYNYYDKKYYHDCEQHGGDSYVALQSMQLKKTGLKILFGKKARLVSGNKMGLELDFFAGIGVQYRYEKLTEFEKQYGSCNYDYSDLYTFDPPEEYYSKYWYPTLHAGILVCVPF